MIATPSQDRFFLAAKRRKEYPLGGKQIPDHEHIGIRITEFWPIFLEICAHFAMSNRSCLSSFGTYLGSYA